MPSHQEVIEGLTSPLDAAALQEMTFERSTPRLVEPETEEHLHRLFRDNLWTDQLPIMLLPFFHALAIIFSRDYNPSE